MNPARFLIIEDNPGDVLLLRYALDAQREQYELAVLEDGAEALQFVHEHRIGKRKPEICLIVLDLHLPKHNGLEILRAIAETPALSHIRVIVMSGAASPVDQEAIQCGGIFRVKPSSIEDYALLGAEMFALCKSSMSAAA